METIHCEILDCSPLNNEIFLIRLCAKHDLDYLAGQYLELKIPGEEYCFFSIANAPGSRYLELHIQVVGMDSSASRVIEFLNTKKSIDVILPMGECTLSSLKNESGPLLLIAAGTGFSQIKAMCEQLITCSLKRQIHLYWSARTVSGLYMSELAEKWHKEDHNFHFSALVSEHNDWQDKQSLMFQAVLEDFEHLNDCQAVCCGSPEMVYTTLDNLIKHGFRKNQMVSDVFSYAPRD